MSTVPERLAYHRLETDREFRWRILSEKKMHIYSAGATLDDDAWNLCQMQRRIVFVPCP